MILPFSLIINGKKNYFIAKIWRSILDINQKTDEELFIFFQKLNEEDQAKIDQVKPKLHTIRRDQSDLWQTGMDIEPVANDDSPSQPQFAPTIKCLAIQMISIEHRHEGKVVVTVDGKILSFEALETLAINDGFDNLDDFYTYFDYNFKGKLIHWTGLKY
ncbi:hypothetical protein [Pedobacter immunditicola]|uniref:hypothetical protein n=1 Tax=Pedobacter immunditicola TaxID=3133440 RepID=UPI003099C29A